jgi:hypothetical protein
MPTTGNHTDFRLTPIAGFDARHGYRRCRIPGIGVSSPSSPVAIADFWWNRSGMLVTRFSCQGYQFSFEISRMSGSHLGDADLEDLAAHVSDLLLLWLIEGIDDDPSV